MADWKKVLVSGSDISVGNITASNIPAAPSDSTDQVLLITSDGKVKRTAQTNIQGTTTANFTLNGSTGTTTFDATADKLILNGTNGASTTLADDGTTSTITVNLPDGTISGSSQVAIASTIGFTAFSASLTGFISGNTDQVTTNNTNITNLTNKIDGLVDSSSLLVNASSSIASFIVTANEDITFHQGSVTALNTFTSSVVTNTQTGSFLLSESVVGTANEITVEANGAQGIRIGLPDDVTIGGTLEAGNVIIQGNAVTETAVSTVGGSTIQGNDMGNVHRFTGSLEITGGLIIDNGAQGIVIEQLDTDNAATIDNIVVRNSIGNILGLAGSGIKQAISGAFDGVSSSLAADIAALNQLGGAVEQASNNSTAISNLNLTSASLLTSASNGIFFSGSGGGSSIALTNTASFVATGNGLSVDVTDVGGITTVEYTVNPTTLANAVNAFSESAQLQTVLDDIYVQLSDAPISGAAQLQNLGFITASDFDALVGVPSGLISGVAATTTQGTIKVNNVEKDIFGLKSTDSPTFHNLTVNGTLTVKGATTALNTEQLNIEDQFILINSGADAVSDNQSGGVIVDSGNGSGSLFMYYKDAAAWGFKGATDPANGVDAEQISNAGNPVVPDVFVGTTQADTGNPEVADAAKYGAGDFAKGQMYINTQESTIWIYV